MRTTLVIDQKDLSVLRSWLVDRYNEIRTDRDRELKPLLRALKALIVEIETASLIDA